MEPDRTATFKLLSEQTGDSVAIFEELIPAGFGTALHLHHTSDEAMCVLSGAFSFQDWRFRFSWQRGHVGIHAEGNSARLEEQWRLGGACTLHVYARGRREAVRRIKTIGAAIYDS